jgi:hypothetical protein
MTMQNRVTPWGEIVATPERGAWMGNRGGCLHDHEKRLGKRRWVNEHWLICRLEFKGRWREVMAPGKYTELFFLDEATALAAGHRPCVECRRADAYHFREAWAAANLDLGLGPTPSFPALDHVLHRDRVGEDRTKRVFPAEWRALPDGVLVLAPPPVLGACLVWKEELRPWTFGGYGPALQHVDEPVLSVLTPRSTVEAIRAGYGPQIHPTAGT